MLLTAEIDCYVFSKCSEISQKKKSKKIPFHYCLLYFWEVQKHKSYIIKRCTVRIKFRKEKEFQDSIYRVHYLSNNLHLEQHQLLLKFHFFWLVGFLVVFWGLFGGVGVFLRFCLWFFYFILWGFFVSLLLNKIKDTGIQNTDSEENH